MLVIIIGQSDKIAIKLATRREMVLGVKLVAFDHDQSFFLGGGGEFFRLGHKIVVFNIFNSLLFYYKF